MNYKITTMTIDCSFNNTTFNLLDIGKYLPIDDTIIGIKYKFADRIILKGEYSITKNRLAKLKSEKSRINFSNQISVIVKNNYQINMKLFMNGSVQLTGLKNKNDVLPFMKLLYNKIENINKRNDKIILTKDSNGIYLDNDNIIYSQTPHYMIGYYHNNFYYINHNEYLIDDVTGCFISTKFFKGKTKQLIDLNGNYIGFNKIELLKGNKNLYKKHIHVSYDNQIYYENDTIPFKLIFYDKLNMILGKIKYYIDTPYKIPTDENLKLIYYKCHPIKSFEEVSLNETHINCINLNFNLGYELNRNRLYKCLTDLDYYCELNSDKYPGLKIIYKLNKHNNGKCPCVLKCTCDNITFSIFQSGIVYILGIKNDSIIPDLVSNFLNIIQPHQSFIQRRNVSN